MKNIPFQYDLYHGEHRMNRLILSNSYLKIGGNRVMEISISGKYLRFSRG